MTTSRTQWPAAARLQAAADAARDGTDPRWHAVADHLDTVANNMAWLAPYRDHEPGLPMWDSAEDLADTILEDQPDLVAERDGLAAVLLQARTILARWDRPYATAHASNCVHAVAELRRLLTPAAKET